MASGLQGTDEAERSSGSKQVGLWAREAGAGPDAWPRPGRWRARGMAAGRRACPPQPDCGSRGRKRRSPRLEALVGQCGPLAGFHCQDGWGWRPPCVPSSGWVTTGLQGAPGELAEAPGRQVLRSLAQDTADPEMGLKGDGSRSRDRPGLGSRGTLSEPDPHVRARRDQGVLTR